MWCQERCQGLLGSRLDVSVLSQAYLEMLYSALVHFTPRSVVIFAECEISVAPDAINHHVKTCRDNLKNLQYIAPEYECMFFVFLQQCRFTGFQ